MGDLQTVQTRRFKKEFREEYLQTMQWVRTSVKSVTVMISSLIDVGRYFLHITDDLVRIRNISNKGERLNKSRQVKRDGGGNKYDIILMAEYYKTIILMAGFGKGEAEHVACLPFGAQIGSFNGIHIKQNTM